MKHKLVITVILSYALMALSAIAHEVRPAVLTITEISESHYFVNWRIPTLQGKRVGIDAQFADQCSLIQDARIIHSGGAATRTFNLKCISGLEGSEIYIRNLAATMIDVMVNIDLLNGQKIHHLIRPTSPSYLVPERQDHTSIINDYIMLGAEHILKGWDHLLFVMGLVLLLRDWRTILIAATGFTLAHSITLCLLALGYIKVSAPAVEAVIALSIIILAVEIIKNKDRPRQTLITTKPWLICGVFGLFHGLGFASALANYGLPDHARLISLLSFNIGVEIGQIIFITCLMLLSLFRRNFPAFIAQAGHQASVWLIGIMGSFWLIDRCAAMIKSGLVG